jgi:AcrR family transcriptional regulator
VAERDLRPRLHVVAIRSRKSAQSGAAQCALRAGCKQRSERAECEDLFPAPETRGMQKLPQYGAGDHRHGGSAHLRAKQSVSGRRFCSRQRKSAAGPERAGHYMEHKRHNERDRHGILVLSDIDIGCTYCIVKKSQGKMNSRPYRSPRRRATAERTRARLLKAASAMLGGPDGVSLDAVAKKAGVTRLTVYNQFGSRRALLEAVFDDMAERGGLHRISAAMADPDPHAALRQIISIFCGFWSIHRSALWRLHAATATDSEFAESLRARNERRQHLLSVIVGRMNHARSGRAKAVSELVDVLFALTSVSFFWELTASGRSADAACRMIQALAEDAVQRTFSETE